MSTATTSTRRLARAELDEPRFPQALCDALFGQVLIDDHVDASLRLPDAVRLDYSEGELIACFRLSRQVWVEGFDRRALAMLAGSLLRDRDLTEEDRTRFKHIRAKFKHFRNAHALYGATHRNPPLFDRITVTMGQAQDAYRHHRRTAVAGRAVQLRLLLTAPSVRWLRSETDTLVPTTPAAFRAMLEAGYAALEALLAARTVSGHGFHAARKIVSRQVSFWNTLETLAPTEDRHRMTRWMSAINGSMGAVHDHLVERRVADRASYGADFVLQGDIRERIKAIVGRVRESSR